MSVAAWAALAEQARAEMAGADPATLDPVAVPVTSLRPDLTELEYTLAGILTEHDVTRAYERDLLWCLFQSAADHLEHLRAALTAVEPDDFADGSHRDLFRWMRKMYRRDGCIEPVEFISTAQQHGQRAVADTAADLWTWSPVYGEPHPWRAVHYAARVHQLAQQRRLVAVAVAEQQALSGQAARLPNGDRIEAGTLPADVVAKTTLVRRQLVKDSDRAGLSKPLGAYRQEAVAEAATSALPFGLRRLDEILKGGARESCLFVVAGRPGMGKTAFMMNAVRRWSSDGWPGLVFSLEMAGHQLYQRLLSDVTELDRSKWNHHMDRIDHEADRLDRLEVMLADRPALTLDQIRAECDRVASQGKLGWVMLDYLTLMGVEGRHDRHDLAVGANAQGLKDLAKEYEVPVILAAQLNRDLEKRQNKRPIVSDLRDSGVLEQAADVILFLYRDHVYNPDSNPADAEIIVAKQRGGTTDTAAALWNGPLTRFEDPFLSDSVLV